MFEKIKKILGNDVQPSSSELEEFTDLTNRLIELMVEFTLLTLRTVSDKKETPLNGAQIEETVNFDLQFRIQQIQDPELLDIVRERAISEFLKEQKNHKKSGK
jgi:Na+-translocating ferredoxin:NAD+ oxidoreductase RnfG subunit